MSTTEECPTNDCPFSVGPPVLHKFRTGSYLIYDDHVDSNNVCGPTNLRKGTDLPDPQFRASGSHQLNVGRLATALKSVNPSGGRLYLVDLREETHLYCDGDAVSWYADKDFANVGQSLEWIVTEEKAQRDKIKSAPVTQIFCITDEDPQTGNVTPTGYREVDVKSAATEEDVAATFSFRPQYIRIPVTDHCMPSEDALNRFVNLCKNLNSKDWVHCHCHGGDGRTTTFLTLFDMVNWAKTKGTAGFPTIEYFAHRQCLIFSYCLNPDGCPDGGKCNPSSTIDWKYYLAIQRWWFLDLVRYWLANGGLNNGEPFRLPGDWDQRIATAPEFMKR
jgi:hypothetical protein